MKRPKIKDNGTSKTICHAFCKYTLGLVCPSYYNYIIFFCKYGFTYTYMQIHGIGSDLNYLLISYFRFGSARRQRKEINLSLVLLAIVFLFFICHACRIINDVYEFSNMDLVVNCPKTHRQLFSPPYFMHALLYISHFATILNSSLNFFVYCLVGHTFRRELCRTLGFKVRTENISTY